MFVKIIALKTRASISWLTVYYNPLRAAADAHRLEIYFPSFLFFNCFNYYIEVNISGAILLNGQSNNVFQKSLAHCAA